jgi:catechol 2,3-dioxygenase-like lactoylglutathione lyase family enzyme
VPVDRSRFIYILAAMIAIVVSRPLCGQVHAPSPVLAGIAHAAMRVSNLSVSRDFYEKLGYEVAFAMDRGGLPTEAFLKINDRQFLELYPRQQPSQQIGFMHVCFESSDLTALNQNYVSQGLFPTPVKRAGAGNLLFTMQGPEQQNIEYTQYMPGSRHTMDRGQHLGEHRISDHILGVSVGMADPTAARTYYIDKLSFLPTRSSRTEDKSIPLALPGNSGEEVDLVARPTGATFYLLLEVSSLHATAKQLRALHVPLTKHKATLTIQDPDGNHLIFVQGKR